MKIYISSTYQDLVEHRAAVDRTLRRMGHDVFGMEQYVAEGSKPVERCKADVRSVDVYVIIVAWRYGYVPGRMMSPPDDRSITQIELEEAKESGRPVLAFLLDPEAPWPPNRVDAMGVDPKLGAAVGALRTSLGSDYLAGIFRTPDDLASQVAAAVSAQGLTRHMVDRVLGETSVAPNLMGFADGQAVADTTLTTIKMMIENSGTTRAIVLRIDQPKWWSTRLFLLANLLRSLTPVRQLVFCGAGGRFAGMASPTAVVEALGTAFPRLSVFVSTLGTTPASPDIENETNRQVDQWRQTFPYEGSEKVDVRAPLLERWLGERWLNRCIRVEGRELSMIQVQQIVDSLLPDVPVQRRSAGAVAAGVVPDAEVIVVDRDAFALELAREWVRSGLPRSQIR